MSVKRVFIDFEFSDFIKRDIISIGAVADSGETFYAENSDEDGTFASEWVKLNVYPLLDAEHCAMPLNELGARLWCWLDELDCESIQIVSDYKGDHDLLLDLLDEDHPKFCNDPIFVYDAILSACLANSIANQDFVGGHNNFRDAKDFYFLEFIGYFKENQMTQHHALTDAVAIQYAFNKTLDEFQFLQVLKNV